MSIQALLLLLLACTEPTVDSAGPGPTEPSTSLTEGPLLLFTDRDAGLIGAWSEASGERTILVDGLTDPRGIVARDDQVWWTDATLGMILSWSPDQPEPTPAIAGLTQPADLAWIDQDWLVADRGASRILRVEASSSREPVVDATPEPYFLAHDGAELWWGEFYGGAIRRAPLTGAPPQVAITGVGNVRGVALSAGRVYWNDRELGTLNSAPVNDPSAATVLYTNLGTPHGLLIVDDTLWWTDTASGTISRAPKDGSGSPELVVDGLVGPWDLTWRP